MKEKITLRPSKDTVHVTNRNDGLMYVNTAGLWVVKNNDWICFRYQTCNEPLFKLLRKSRKMVDGQGYFDIKPTHVTFERDIAGSNYDCKLISFTVEEEEPTIKKEEKPKIDRGNYLALNIYGLF